MLSLSVGACVASITQNKEISGQSIKNSLQWHSWISASHNSSVGCLALQCQCLSHAAVYLSDQWSSYSKALIPFLQHLHGQVWFQSPILRRPYRVHSHRWRNWQLWGQELILTGENDQGTPLDLSPNGRCHLEYPALLCAPNHAVVRRTLKGKFMELNTFTLTAWLTSLSCGTPGPKSLLAFFGHGRQALQTNLPKRSLELGVHLTDKIDKL